LGVEAFFHLGQPGITALLFARRAAGSDETGGHRGNGVVFEVDMDEEQVDGSHHRDCISLTPI
jgi:hypothetical protein